MILPSVVHSKKTLLLAALVAFALPASLPVWALSTQTATTDEGANVQLGTIHPMLEGHIVGHQGSPIDGLFDLESKVRIASTAQSKKGVAQQLGSSTKSVANFLLDLRGFGFSKEGADAILDEKIDPKNESAREYLMRRELDGKELVLSTAIMKLVDGKHASCPKASARKLAARQVIDAILPEEEAIDIYCRLFDLQSGHALPMAWAQSWDLDDRDQKQSQIFEAAVDHDPVIKDIKDRLHKYNSRSKLLQVSAKVVYSTLGIASFTPTLVAPIAETSLLTFMYATGGPEQDKLLKELYLGKCLESRYRLIVQKTSLITDSYNRAVLTQNSTLMQCTKELLHSMTDETCTEAVLAGMPMQPVAAASLRAVH